MTPPPPSAGEAGARPLRRWPWLLAVALVALITRVSFEWAVHQDGGPVGTLASHLLGDERAYDSFARGVAAGGPGRERAFYQEPLYAWLVGQVYRLAPPPPIDADTAAIVHAPVHRAIVLLQHALGVLTALLVATLGWRCLGPRVGVLAGFFAAISGPLVFTEAMLLKESLGLLLWVLTLHLWLDVLQDRGGRLRALLLGLALGLGILLRGNTYLLATLVGCSLLLRLGGRRRVVEAALAALAALLAISPATIHNLRRGDFVLTTYQAGTNAAIGQPDAPEMWRGVQYDPLLVGRGDALFEEEDAIALAEARSGRPLKSREISAFWWRTAWEQASARPLVAAGRVGLKLLYTFHGDEVPDVKDWYFYRQALPWLATPLSDLSWLGPLALLGFLFLPWRGAPLLVLRGGVVAVMLSLALFYVMGRYRLSVAPLLWILAAGAIDTGLIALSAAWRQPGARLRALGLLLLAAAVIAAGRVPLRPDSTGLQVSWSNLASVEIVRMRLATTPEEASARREAALAAAQEALRLAPQYPDARLKLVHALEMNTPVLAARSEEAADQAWRVLMILEGERTGKNVLANLDRPLASVVAIVTFLRGVPSIPEREGPIASVLAKASRRVAQELRNPEEQPLALDLLAQSLRLEPGETIALTQKGLAYRRGGLLREAEAAYREALAAGEDSVELHNNLGNLLLGLRRPAEAVPHFQRALELEPGNEKVLVNLERAKSATADPP
ncbi:MAG: glycosyltransferase family 39 protein [Planctomycetota bacterium]